MKTEKRTTVVGVFENRQQAQKAVQELRRLGFRDDQIGVISREEKRDAAGKVESRETYAEEGAVAGVATGAGIGALWGIGIAAGLLPAIGPVIAGGTLAAILASAALGAAAAGIAGALIGLGIPEEEAKYYESEFQSGRTIVTVKANGRYDEAWAVIQRFQGYDFQNRSIRTDSAHAASTRTEAGKTVQAREEELHVRKEPVKTGEVHVRKEVHTEHKTLEVPVQKEEVVIERRTDPRRPIAASDIKPGEEIRIPVREEQVHVEKEAVVKEEVSVGKRKVQDTEKVAGTVRKEQIKVEKKGDVDVREERR